MFVSYEEQLLRLQQLDPNVDIGNYSYFMGNGQTCFLIRMVLNGCLMLP